MGMIRLLILPWSRSTPMFGLMVVLSLIRLLAIPLLVLVSLLNSLSLSGMLVAGVRLILSALWGIISPVEVSVLFQGLFSLFRGLKCGGHIGFTVFWCCSFGC